MIVSPITPPVTPNSALKTRDKPDESLDFLVDQLSTVHVDSDDGYYSSATGSPNLNLSPELPKRTAKVDQRAQTLSIEHEQEKLDTSSDDEAIHLFELTTDVVENSRSQTLPIDQEQENFDASSDTEAKNLGKTCTSVGKSSNAKTLTISQEQYKLDASNDGEATHLQKCMPPTDKIGKPFIQLLFPLIFSKFLKVHDKFNHHMRQAYAGYNTEWLYAGCRLGSRWKRILVAHDNSTALMHEYVISLMNMVRQGVGRQDANNRMREKLTNYAIQLQWQFSQMKEDLDEAVGIFCNRMEDIKQLMYEVIVYTQPRFQTEEAAHFSSIKQSVNEHTQLLHKWYKEFDIHSRNKMTKIKNLLISEMCEARLRYRSQFVQTIWKIFELRKLEESVALNLNATDVILNKMQEKCIYVHRRLIEIQKSQFEEIEQVSNEHEKCKLRIFESMEKELRDICSYPMD